MAIIYSFDHSYEGTFTPNAESKYTINTILTEKKDLTNKTVTFSVKIRFFNTKKWELPVIVKLNVDGAVKDDFTLYPNDSIREESTTKWPDGFTGTLKFTGTVSDFSSCTITLTRKGKTSPILTISSTTLGIEDLYSQLSAPTLTKYSPTKDYAYIGDTLRFGISSVANANSYKLAWKSSTSTGYRGMSYASNNINISTDKFVEGVYYFYAIAERTPQSGDQYIYNSASTYIYGCDITIEEPPTILAPTNLSGPSSITGGSSGTFTASNPNSQGYAMISVEGQSSTSPLTYYPTSSGSKTVTAYCYYYDSSAGRGFSSSYVSIPVTVSDPSWSLTCTPSSGYATSIQCSTYTGTPCWYVAAGTTKSNAAIAKGNVYQGRLTSTGSDWGIVKVGNVSEITEDDLLSWYSGDKSSLEIFYYYIGCYTEIGSYTTDLKWNSACYTFGSFDGRVTDTLYWNNPDSTIQSFVTDVPKTYFQDQFYLRWTNPKSTKLLGSSITSISVQARSSEDSGWITCETTGTISTAAAASNLVKVNYKTAGTTYIRVLVVTSNSSSTETKLDDYLYEKYGSKALTSVQFQTSSFNVDIKNNLHPFANNSTTLKFNWFDSPHTDMACQEKVSLLMSIWEGNDTTKISQKYILTEDSNNYIKYTSAKDVTEMSALDMLDYYTVKPTYYHNLKDAEETNNLFINTVKQGDEKAVLNGRYCYNFTLTVSNAFGKSKTITSTTYNLQFGQPPTFADGSSVDTKIYPYLTKSQTAATLWENAKLPADLNRMVNPTETLVFKFPQATDPNDDLAYYRLYACRLDDWNSNTAEPNADSCVYEELGTYNISDQVSNVDGIVYLAYTLASNYAYSKYCYFKITALDKNYDESGAIYYLPDEKPYILRGRATTANLGISEVTLGYYEPTTDTTPRAGVTYYTYDGHYYIVYKESTFDDKTVYYEKIEGISGKLVINSPITKQEPDLGGNLFQNSTTKYSDFPNLDKLEEDYKDYTLVLKWSTTSDFTDDTTDSITFKREKETGTYYNGLITAHNDGIYTSGGVIDDKRFNGKKIYIRFELSIRYAIDDFDSDGNPIYRSELVSYSPIAVIYGNTPTISPRPNYIGINTNEFESNDVVVVSTASTVRRMVRFKGIDDDSQDYIVSLDISNGNVIGLAIDCGTWT